MTRTQDSPGQAPRSHIWRFARVGGVDQVVLESGADIVHLPDLDQKLWMALACPARGLELDQRTLDLIDTDKDGRIRVPEVLAAVRWAADVFKDPDNLLQGEGLLQLSAINDKTPDGAALLGGARRILENLGKGGQPAVALADVADTAAIFAATRFNGDGVLPADSAEDEDTRKAIEDILATHGSVLDRSGKQGVDQPRVEAFFGQAAALLEWSDKATGTPAILPLGAGTEAAAAAVAAVKVKVDDYFARCRLAAFDPRAAGALNRDEAELHALAAKDLTSDAAEIARLPLSRVEAGRPLQLTEGVNPAWTGALADLARAALAPLLGAPRTSLTEVEWLTIQARLAPYREWNAAKPATAVEGLGLLRLRALAGSGAKDRITALIASDLALADENAQISAVEKALLYRRDLFRLLHNFVNFSELYGRKGAVFQAGTLYLDGRACDLCVSVADAAKHAALAGLSKAYLAYCDCTRPGGEKMTIAAVFSDGDSDYLMAGRNGVFYDRKGRDWDATITKVIENPISLRQAFWAPYKSFVRMIEEQVAKRAATADTEATERLKMAATATAHADQAGPAAKSESKKIDVGTVAAIGVAIAGVATFLSSILATFFGLGRWMPFGLLALVLSISGPSVLIAWLKLRQRSLAPILDANGWAINGRVRLNVPFGRALTSVATLPHGSERSLRDPFAEKGSPWRLYTVLLLLLGLGASWYIGALDSYLPPAARSERVLGSFAPTHSASEDNKGK